MTSSNGNIFHVTGHLCGEFTGRRRGALIFSLICTWIHGWVNKYNKYNSQCTHCLMFVDDLAKERLDHQSGHQQVSLLWRHNGHNSVSNHQPYDCLLRRLFRRRSKQTSKLRVTGLCAGNSPGPVNFPHKWPVTRKMFPFDDVIMWYWIIVRGLYLTYLYCKTRHPFYID